MRSGLFLIVLFFAIASCNSRKPNELELKKQELNKLRDEQREISAKITKLEEDIAASDTSDAKNARVKTVTVAEVKPVVFKHFISIQGSLEADKNIMVNPRTPGVVTRVNVTEGQRVRSGQVLAEVDASMITQSIAELKTRLDLANTTYERQKNLWDQKIGSEMQYLSAKNAKESLERSLSTLQTQYANTRITSPIDGYVDEVIIKVGETATPGVGAVRVVNLAQLKVSADVADTHVGKIKEGDNVIISFPDLNEEVEAKVSFVGKVIDPNSRTFNVEVKVSNKNEKYKPNMLAIIKVNDYTNPSAVVISGNLLQKVQDGYEVYVAENKKGKIVAHSRKVETGQNYDGQVEVLNGLKPGDKVVTTGYQELADGQMIKI